MPWEARSSVHLLPSLPAGRSAGWRGWRHHQEPVSQGRLGRRASSPPPPPRAAAALAAAADPPLTLSWHHLLLLVLQDKKGRLYIVTAAADTMVDLKSELAPNCCCSSLHGCQH